MKASLATALSISGVFAAGATAFAVNSAVLVTPSAAGAGTEISVPADSTLPASPDSSVPDAGTGADVVTMSDTSATYEVGEAGTVVVDIVDGIPVIVSVSPATGWTADVRPATSAYGDAKVVFTGSTMRVIFEVDIENGMFDVDVESAPLTTVPRHDDDDHDEDHDDDDDDHEDDDHDDD